MYNETLKLDLPDAVLDYTEGKRALICGGQGAREEQRRKLRKIFEFLELDWFHGERGSEKSTNEAVRAIRGGSYDMAFLLTSFTGHHSGALVKEAKRMEVPIIMIPSGYSPQAFSYAIQQQVCRHQERQAMARSSGQMVAQGRAVNY